MRSGVSRTSLGPPASCRPYPYYRDHIPNPQSKIPHPKSFHFAFRNIGKSAYPRRAATAAFVYSFIFILGLDLLLGIALDSVYYTLWPRGAKLF